MTGDYPSATYLLPSAGGAAGLTNATFNAKVKSGTAFEYWASDGSYETGAGDGDITAANIVASNDIFGTVGTATAASSPNCAGLTDSWVLVAGDTDYGTSDFCIMQYEAKNVSSAPESNVASTPWVSIDQQDSRTECALSGRATIR